MEQRNCEILKLLQIYKNDLKIQIYVDMWAVKHKRALRVVLIKMFIL